MSYCTYQDITTRLPEDILVSLTQDDENKKTADQNRVLAAIADAGGLIDQKLGQRYVTPLASPVPMVVLRLSVDITVYNLHKARYNNVIPTDVLDAYYSALQQLENYTTGRILQRPGMPLPTTNINNAIELLIGAEILPGYKFENLKMTNVITPGQGYKPRASFDKLNRMMP